MALFNSQPRMMSSSSPATQLIRISMQHQASRVSTDTLFGRGSGDGAFDSPWRTGEAPKSIPTGQPSNYSFEEAFSPQLVTEEHSSMRLSTNHMFFDGHVPDQMVQDSGNDLEHDSAKRGGKTNLTDSLIFPA